MENSRSDIAELIISESHINNYFLHYLKRSLIEIERGKIIKKTDILRLRAEKEYAPVTFKKLVLYPISLFLKPVLRTPLVKGLSSEEITEIAREYKVSDKLLEDYVNFKINKQKSGGFVDLWDQHNIQKKDINSRNTVEGAYCDLILRRISEYVRPLDVVKDLENKLSD